MRRPVCLRLTVCIAATATTAALGVLLAPAASADPGPSDRGPSASTLVHLRQDTQSAVPAMLANVPWLGRKL